MKIYRTLLKLWITLTSLLAFVGGWILLGHSGKPVSAQAAAPVQDAPVQDAPVDGASNSGLAPLPTLAPLDPLPSLGSGQNFQPSQSIPQAPSPSQLFRPRLRTRGS